MDFLQDYTLKSLRLKQDKWNKLVISDEQRGYMMRFIEQDTPQELIISQNIGGQLQVIMIIIDILLIKGVPKNLLTFSIGVCFCVSNHG